MNKLQLEAQRTLQPFLDMSGYQPKTTFWLDFTIANKFGEKAVKDTYNRAFDEWKTNIEYLTELVLTLNWQIWYWHEKNEERAELYDKLWKEADQWCMKNLKDDDLAYYLRTTD